MSLPQERSAPVSLLQDPATYCSCQDLELVVDQGTLAPGKPNPGVYRTDRNLYRRIPPPPALLLPGARDQHQTLPHGPDRTRY